MWFSSLIFSFFLYSVQGKGEFLVFSAPPSAVFSGNQPIDQVDVSDVVSACLGFTTQKDTEWTGLSISNPFNYAEAVVTVAINGVPSLGSHSKTLASYPLSSTEEGTITYEDIKENIVERFPTQNNTLVRIELGGLTGHQMDVKTTALDKDVEEDSTFLEELHELQHVTDKLKKQKIELDGVPDSYWFEMNGLHALSDVRGAHHPATLEAKEKTYNAVLRLAAVMNKIYNKRVLVIAIVSDMSHTRHTRNLMQAANNKADTENGTDWNLATVYRTSYPAIFNIILWFSVVFILSLIAVSIFIATMDPGRDSIIYRMTSNRMKKDS